MSNFLRSLKIIAPALRRGGTATGARTATAPAGWQALLAAGIYLCIHIAEGEAIAPMLLARRFILNPVLVIIALLFWSGCGASRLRSSPYHCL